jgi:hypothetical protein
MTVTCAESSQHVCVMRDEQMSKQWENVLEEADGGPDWAPGLPCTLREASNAARVEEEREGEHEGQVHAAQPSQNLSFVAIVSGVSLRLWLCPQGAWVAFAPCQPWPLVRALPRVCSPCGERIDAGGLGCPPGPALFLLPWSLALSQWRLKLLNYHLIFAVFVLQVVPEMTELLKKKWKKKISRDHVLRRKTVKVFRWNHKNS